jgi:NADP-dependent 3-hydroxy acid dehydrogenase YdfG
LSSFRSALVTGGRSGIGAAIVSALERDGVDVTGVERRA